MSDYLDLRKIIEEYTIFLEVGEHRKLPELNSKICSKFVELFCSQKEIDEERGSHELARPEWDLLNSICTALCDQLRNHSRVAQAYSDVLDFVNIQDMICLSEMVCAVNEESICKRPLENSEQLTKILRQSVYLMKQFTSGAPSLPKKECWLDSRNLTCLDGVSFPIYKLNLGAPHEVTQNEIGRQSEKLKSLASLIGRTGFEDYRDFLQNFLLSNWFSEFVENVLERPYPLDRFTILISLWIVARWCEHELCEKLICELVDKIYHEEVNCLNEDELMQLKQVGSFWLTHRKRFQVHMKYGATGQLFETTSEDDSATNEYSSAEEGDQSSAGSSTESVAANNVWADSRVGLRKSINEELLYGSECVICRLKPDELFWPIGANSETCPNCHWTQLQEYCSISFRPLPLVSIEQLRKPLAGKELILLTPSEWTRRMLAPRLAGQVVQRLRNLEERYDGGTLDKIDITENFERLIVTRDSDTDSGSEEDEETGLQRKCSRSDDEDEVPMENEKNYLDALDEFLKFKLKLPTRLSLTDSVLITRFSKDHGNRFGQIPLCLSNFLLLEQRAHSMYLNLITSNYLLASGSLWSCRASLVGATGDHPLVYGCRRVFCSLELLRLAQANSSLVSEQFSCPFCRCSLIELKSLAELSV